MKRILSALFSALLLQSSAHIAASELPEAQISQEGLSLNMGLELELLYPIIKTSGTKEKPFLKSIEKDKALLTYNTGASVTVSKTAPDSFSFDFKDIPDKNSKAEFSMLLPLTLADTCKWSMDEGLKGEFPRNATEKHPLASGNCHAFKVDNSAGAGLLVSFEYKCYHQLQDNRKWSWNTYQWHAFMDLPKGDFTIRIKFAPVKNENKTNAFVVDRFGQSVKTDFPWKIKDETELKNDIKADKDYLASFNPPERDPYGGLPGSRERFGLKKTGFFYVTKIKTGSSEKDVFVTPDGNIFFQLGTCTMQPCDDYTYIKGRRNIYEWIPERKSEYGCAFRNGEDAFSFYIANLVRKYGKAFDKEEWSGLFVDKLRTWGFNSIGAFGGATKTTATKKFPYAAGLPLNEYDIPHIIHGFFDPFDPQIIEKIDKSFASKLPSSADDPLIIGYFLANEQKFSDIPKLAPSLKTNVPAKLELVKMLSSKYKNNIEAFNAVWKMNIKSFDELNDLSFQASGPEAGADMKEYMELFVDTYFKVVVNTFRKYDKKHLLIGNRFLPAMANIELVNRISGKYMDVISVNYYTKKFDQDFLRKIHSESGGRPILLSEWSYGTAENGLSGGVVNVNTQKERGLAYRNYVEQGAALDFVVGSQWFASIDQALTGRWFQKYNGENMNIGIVDVADRPFKDFINEASKTNYDIYKVKLGEKNPFLYADFSSSGKNGAGRMVMIPRALEGMKVDGNFSPWPGRPSERIGASNLVLGSDPGKVSCDFWLCHDDKYLYIYADVNDPSPCQNPLSGENMWNGDGLEIFIGAEPKNQNGELRFTDRQIVISAGKPAEGSGIYYHNSPKQYESKSVVVQRPDASGYVIEAAIPWEALSIKPESGKEFLFDIGIEDRTVDSGKRIRQFMWNGEATNSSSRNAWGTAKLVD